MPKPKVKDLLHNLNLKPTKERGQNFLIDASIVEAILDFAKVQQASQLIEIGPGLGALTRELRHLGPLSVIEIEEKFCKELAQNFPEIEIVNEDVRQVDFSSLGENLIVFGNLPYSFSTDIIFHLVDYATSIKKAILLLQKEFAERLAAKPGKRIYGKLSVAAQLWADVRLGPIVSGKSFHPPAKVDSCLVELRFLEAARFPVKDMFYFKRTLQAAFFKKRKKILNSIVASAFFKECDIAAVLAEAKIDTELRAESLSVEDFVRLANVLNDKLGRAEI